MNVNDVKVVGNVVAKPEVKFTPKGVPVTTVAIGVNETMPGKKQITTFLDVRVWGQSAENLAKLADKGKEIFVEGALRQEQWQDKTTGKERSKIFINANSWQFTQRKGAPARDAEMER
jgi:single-strand DNA-binding protein